MQKNNETITPPLPDLDLCPVKGGDFIMGYDNSEYDDEKPAHSVHVAGFYMGKFQVTQRLWESVTGDNPSKFKGERRPVETVSWGDAQTFLDKLNARTDVQAFIRQLDPPGTEFRLPTEAEWEFAARAGTSYKYSGGDDLNAVAWYGENSGDSTYLVGQKKANALGLYDMSGNVWEWCADWYDRKYYACSPQENPTGPDSGARRVLRGGSRVSHPVCCRSVIRINYEPELRLDTIGFRLVLPFQL